MMKTIHGIAVKKKYGQHFLHDDTILQNICKAITLDQSTSVFEIGCGDGRLTKTILSYPVERLWVFEIDSDWAHYVRATYPDDRLTVFEENILQVALDERLGGHAPWVLLANLPYNITFPILHQLQKNRALLRAGVIMVQHEVAVKLLKRRGRDYGPASLFFQHYFDMASLGVIPPEAFYPPPQVHSELLLLKPRTEAPEIVQEEGFWKFIGACFAHPRRTLRNNLAATVYASLLSDDMGTFLRAQDMAMADFLRLWHLFIGRSSTDL